MTSITFSPEASDSLNTALDAISGFTVQVTPEEGVPFDATLIGPDHDAGWVGTILVRRYDEERGTSVGPTFSVVAKDIEVY
jgi:hypothetical protein